MSKCFEKVNQTVEKWILQGTFLTKLNFGDLDYSKDDLATISATLRMDRCIQIF